MAEQEDRMTIYLRTTRELHQWLKALAKKNNRSLNQQAEWLLLGVKEEDDANQAGIKATEAKAKKKPRKE
jgi:hypothetical protein